METAQLPSSEQMYRALRDRDTTYEGVFVVGVRTTGIFCRPGCSAKTPKVENIEFYPSSREALLAGYRPCKRCRPMELAGAAPEWLSGLLTEVGGDATRRWKDTDLRAMGVDPARARRWFQANHGMTFHAYVRAHRLGQALGNIKHGGDLTRAAFDAGYESASGFRDAFAQMFGTTPGRGRNQPVMKVNRIPTPLGMMIAGATDDGLCLLEFADRRMLEKQLARLSARLGCVATPGDHPYLDQLANELSHYFDGTLERFTIPLVFPGTEFQRSVWNSLLDIPYGETRSYQDLAVTVGRPGATRAVGTANGDNRIAVVIPCHRVIRSDGNLGGYGGRLWRKRFLLDLEGTLDSRELFDGAEH